MSTAESEPDPQTGSDARAGSSLKKALSRDPLGRALTTLAKVLGVVVTVVTLAGGLVTLLFQVDPTLEPCIGSSGVDLTGIQVYPGYPYDQYLTDLGVGGHHQNSFGVEVRYQYTISNLSGADLLLRGTLQQLATNGIQTAPKLNGFDRAVYMQRTDLVPGFGSLERELTPSRCSQDGSGIYWMQLPSQVPIHHQYRISLELFRGSGLTDRVGVGVTPVFDH